MLSEKLGHRFDRPLAWLINKSFLGRIHPTALTLTGLLFNLIAAGTIITGHWKAAAILILMAGFFDMLDGATARTLKKTSRFGGFIDSVTDRYSDMALLIAFIIYYAFRNKIFMVTLASIAALGSVLIPYTRAKAEAFINHCNVGIMERAERILLIATGSFFNIMDIIFWILAILTHLTVLQRIYYTWKEIQKLERGEIQT